MQKHAYLIMAHNNLQVLNLLLKMLDDERNDIFIHLDKKSKLNYTDLYRSQKAKTFHVNKRINIVWGDLSQIILELTLLRFAFEQGPYIYYHLLSGSDLPIKSQDYIHNFFNKHSQYEFIGFAQGEANELDCKSKALRYHFMTKWNKTKHPIKKLIKKIIISPLEIIANGLLKRKTNVSLKKGANWISITHNCCAYILSKESFIKNKYKYTLCADEIFVQTLIYNSPFYLKCYNTSDEYIGCQREIDWNRGNPYEWQENDLDILLKSNKLFARKITDNNIELAYKLYNKIKNS